MEPLGTQEVEQLITRFKGPIMCYCSAFWALNIIVKSVASSDNQSASAAEISSECPLFFATFLTRVRHSNLPLSGGDAT